MWRRGFQLAAYRATSRGRFRCCAECIASSSTCSDFGYWVSSPSTTRWASVGPAGPNEELCPLDHGFRHLVDVLQREFGRIGVLFPQVTATNLIPGRVGVPGTGRSDELLKLLDGFGRATRARQAEAQPVQGRDVLRIDRQDVAIARFRLWKEAVSQIRVPSRLQDVVDPSHVCASSDRMTDLGFVIQPARSPHGGGRVCETRQPTPLRRRSTRTRSAS